MVNLVLPGRERPSRETKEIEMDFYNVKEAARGLVYVGDVDANRAIDYVADTVAMLAANGHEDPANARFSNDMWIQMEAEGRVPTVRNYSE
ncbi:hypothetical protein [Curtobacterium phage Parvaparticeps]|nr:hypothetical protein [Curtobacterium phage Parvaparticeps]